MRVFLAAYFSTELHAAGPRRRAVPALVYTHDLWEHKTKEHLGERLRGKWLIPRADAGANRSCSSPATRAT